MALVAALIEPWNQSLEVDSIDENKLCHHKNYINKKNNKVEIGLHIQGHIKRGFKKFKYFLVEPYKYRVSKK